MVIKPFLQALFAHIQTPDIVNKASDFLIFYDRLRFQHPRRQNCGILPLFSQAAFAGLLYRLRCLTLESRTPSRIITNCSHSRARDCPAVDDFGNSNVPRSRRFPYNTNPLRSHTKILIIVRRRFKKINTSPLSGSRPSPLRTKPLNPS